MMPLMPSARPLPMVGVMGSGTRAHHSRAQKVGRWLAMAGVHLLTGGGGGVMAAVSEAFFKVSDRNGSVIGILPAGNDERSQPPPGYPNPWVEIPILTHLPFSGSAGTDLQSRNHINILTCRVIIALPGSTGTASEVRSALKYNRPLVAFLKNREEIPGLLDAAMVTDQFDQVTSFVRAVLGS